MNVLIERVKGKKHPDDEIILFNGHAPSFLEILEVILQHMKNEHNIYPPTRCRVCINAQLPCSPNHLSKPYEGKEKLKKFMIKYISEERMPTEEELKFYKLGKYRPTGDNKKC